ncbi:MAG: D-aminoacyl-tRNA deacylase [Turicibacter sp.]|nr:D-aminoacyl-tRNA deacylase [Turicibacter sp.]
MKIILQRVAEASVSVDGVEVGSISKGYLLLLGVSSSDTETDADKLLEKIAKLRIFADDNGKTNVSIADVDGELLVVSQFTLYADCKKGNRPSFVDAGDPALAEKLYDYFVECAKTKLKSDKTPLFKKVAQGVFGASMQLSLTNDGPFTLILDTDKKP